MGNLVSSNPGNTNVENNTLEQKEILSKIETLLGG